MSITVVAYTFTFLCVLFAGAVVFATSHHHQWTGWYPIYPYRDTSWEPGGVPSTKTAKICETCGLMKTGHIYGQKLDVITDEVWQRVFQDRLNKRRQNIQNSLSYE